MSTLSVVIITFNEADNIRECLESVKWADEIVVVDSLSTDRTRELAREYTEHVIERTWQGHVDQKNFALERATSDWVLSIDADERVGPELAAEIRQAVQRDDPRIVGYTMPRRTFYLGRWINHGGWYPNRKLRMVRRGKAHWGGVNPHDHLYADGSTADLKGDLVHYTYRDIADHLRTIDSFTTIAAREMYSKGRRTALPYMLLNPPLRTVRMYLLRAGFLDGVPGFIVAALAGYYVFLKYAKLWELCRREKPAR